MDPMLTKTFAAVAKGMGAIWKRLRPFRAEAAAGETPNSFKPVDQGVFDDVLRRIAAAEPSDSIFKVATLSFANELFTPDHLRTMSVQIWLQEPNVRRDLMQASSAKLFGASPPQDAVERLEARYREIASASAQESLPVVESICAMLAAGIKARVDDTGTAALLTAGFNEVHSRLDGLAKGQQPATNLALAAPDAETAVLWQEAFGAASRPLLRWPVALASGELIPRPELGQLISLARSNDAKTVALLGLPGSGKSALLARLGNALSEAPGMPVLAIKGDLLGTSVATEENLQKDLQLPELPSTMLRRFALAGPVALLIDQLDALAGHLDTKTGRLSVLLNLVKAVSNIDGIHVFVSCRMFEYTHDIRLSRVDAESVNLQLPSWDQVLSILEAQGVKAGSWNSDAKEVVRVPQQLNTFLQLRAVGIDEPVSNYTAMLDSLWNERVLKGPNGGGAAELATEIAELMAEKETLWLAGARFDNRTEDVGLLMSAGVLTRSEQGSVGFSHQTVFEHVLARGFAKNEGGLSTYVLARTDSLFVRPKLWSALGYLRGVEPASYQAELERIWREPGLRKHLRFLLLEFLGSQPKPTDREALLLAAAIKEEDLRPLVLKAIAGSDGWFKRFAGNAIPEAMGDERSADICARLLADAWTHSASQVEALLNDVWLPKPANDRRMLLVLQEASAWTSGLLQAAKTVAGRIELNSLHADHFVAVVGSTQPELAIELLGIFLDSELRRRTVEAERLKDVASRQRPASDDEATQIAWHMRHSPRRPIDSLMDDRQGWGTAVELAAVSPGYFISSLWPWYLRAFSALLEFSESAPPYFGYPLPYVADFRFDGENRNKLLPSSLLEAIVLATEMLAESSPEELVRWADENASVELAPVQRLIAHALAKNPKETASHAFRFLLADERRYHLGNVTSSSSTSLSLVAACAPHWGSAEVAKFSEKVRKFAPVRPPEKNAPDEIRWWTRFVRKTRVNLLRALPLEVRSPDVQRDVDEGSRVFPESLEPTDSVGEWIGPPMDALALSRASNKDVLNAFMRIPDSSGWDHPKHFARGGNVQLAQAFAEFAKEHPTRAIELIELFQPEFGQRAAGYAIDALAERHDANGLMALAVALHRRGFQSEEFIDSIARAVVRLLERRLAVDQNALQMLESWLFRRQPVPKETHEPEEESPPKNDSFLLSGHQGTDLVPSGDYPVVSALVQARLATGDVATVIQLLRRFLSHSQDARTWEALTYHLSRIPLLNSTQGPSLIGDVLSLPQLDGTRGAAQLMAHTRESALDDVLRNLSRWRSSNRLATRKGYGELVALIALTIPSNVQVLQWLDDLIDTPAFGDARTGAMATAVQILWPAPQLRAGATDLILRLLRKREDGIWKGVFGLFRVVDRLEPEVQTIRLLQGIADEIQFAPPPEEPYVVERLGTLLPHHADIVARIASHLIQLWRDQLANMGSAIVTAAQEMVDLAVTLHRTEGTKLEGLQMFEQLIEIDAYQAREILDELDHRVRLGAMPSRPRLARRARRRTR